LKTAYFILGIIFILGLGGLAGVVLFYSPNNAPAFAFIGLYASVFAAGFGGSGILLLIFRSLFRLKNQQNFSFGGIFRQALFLGLLSSLALYLQSFRLLNIFTLGLLFLSAAILELYFLNRQ